MASVLWVYLASLVLLGPNAHTERRWARNLSRHVFPLGSLEEAKQTDSYSSGKRLLESSRSHSKVDCRGTAAVASDELYTQWIQLLCSRGRSFEANRTSLQSNSSLDFSTGCNVEAGVTTNPLCALCACLDEMSKLSRKEKKNQKKAVLKISSSASVAQQKMRTLKRIARNIGLRHFQPIDSAPQFRFTPIEQTVSPGTPVSLKCSAVGSPTPIISWTRDGAHLLPSLRTSLGSFRLEGGEVVSYVNISNVTPRDSGLFRCTVENPLGVVSSSSRINVYGPPFIRPMMNVSVVAGEDFSIRCPFGGFPIPMITWKHNDQALPMNLRQEVLQNHTLSIHHAKEEDQGRYTCLAEGRKGQTDIAHTYLRIINPPMIEKFVFSDNLKEGQRTQLTCMVTTGDLPITIQWLKDDRHLPHDPDLEQKQMSDYSMVLLFQRLSERHSGKYTCVAANTAASTNETAVLNVKVPPKWILSPSDTSVPVGKEVRFECVARGVPKPNIQWMKSGEETRDFQRIIDGHRIVHWKNGTLILSDVRKSDGGLYLCQATNGIGSPISKITKVSVIASPEIISSGGRVLGHFGRSARLECEARGDPPLNINWFKKDKALLESQRISINKMEVGPDSFKSILTFDNLQSWDRDQYQCNAVNEHGQQSRNFELVVLEPPMAPMSIEVNGILSRSVEVSWTVPQPSTVTLQYKEASLESWADDARNLSVGKGDHRALLQSLSPFTKYSVRLFASNELGSSAPSNVIMFATLEEAPSGSPRDIRVSSHEPGSLQISWRPPLESSMNGNIRGYIIALRRQSIRGDFQYITRPALNLEFQTAVEEYTITRLPPNTLFEVSIKAFNHMGSGPLSSPRIVQTTMPDAPGCPPNGVSCKGDSLSGIRVWWEPSLISCSQAPITGYSILATPTEEVNSHSGESVTTEVFTTNLEKNLSTMPPSSNISVVVRAYNNRGFGPSSRNIFCQTLDNVPPAPERLRVISAEEGSFVAVWLAPSKTNGKISRYTLYYDYGGKVMLIPVANTEADSTWKKVTGFRSHQKITVWVTASTSAGEGVSSPRVSVTLSATSSYGPFAISSQTEWKVSENSAVTLRCRGIGMPRPTLKWLKDERTLLDDQRHQILPGGDLYLIPEMTANYTCLSESSFGKDRLVHHVIVLSAPSLPLLSINDADFAALNVSAFSQRSGRAPILGYKVYWRFDSREWEEHSIAITNSNSPSSFLIKNLPCGSDIHLYAISWNSQGMSPPSQVLVTATLGDAPPRPLPGTLIEVNSSCVTLRLYAWPEKGCPIQNWKVQGKEESEDNWKTFLTNVGRDAVDVGYCDLISTATYLLKITATSEAGPTTVIYKVSLQDIYSGTTATEHVQEILMGSDAMVVRWLDPHIIAGIVSAILLTAAIVICSCVVFRKQFYERGGLRSLKEVESKRPGSDIPTYHLYSPIPTKKQRSVKMSNNDRILSQSCYGDTKLSRPSLISFDGPDEDIIDGDEVYPYATFSAGSMDETVEYGISLHTHSPTSRECLEGAQHDVEEIYKRGKERTHSHYSDSESNRLPSKLAGNERGGRPRLNSVRILNSDLTKELEKLPRISQRDKKGNKLHQPSGREQGMNQAALATEGCRNSISSSNDRIYGQSVPIQTLYAGHVDMSSGAESGKREGGARVSSSRHASTPSNDSLTSEGSAVSIHSLLSPGKPLHPPSAFSDSRELSETECDREISLRQQEQQFVPKLKPGLDSKSQQSNK